MHSKIDKYFHKFKMNDHFHVRFFNNQTASDTCRITGIRCADHTPAFYLLSEYLLVNIFKVKQMVIDSFREEAFRGKINPDVNAFSELDCSV